MISGRPFGDGRPNFRRARRCGWMRAGRVRQGVARRGLGVVREPFWEPGDFWNIPKSFGSGGGFGGAAAPPTGPGNPLQAAESSSSSPEGSFFRESFGITLPHHQDVFLMQGSLST